VVKTDTPESEDAGDDPGEGAKVSDGNLTKIIADAINGANTLSNWQSTQLNPVDVFAEAAAEAVIAAGWTLVKEDAK
jgi:hypothetical protein